MHSSPPVFLEVLPGQKMLSLRTASTIFFSAILFIVGCTSQQSPIPTPTDMITLTATASPVPTSTAEDRSSEILGWQDEFAVTITGTVRDVVPVDSLIIIKEELSKENQAIAVQSDSILIGKDENLLTLTEISRGMLIQATGQPQEDDFLVAQQVLVLAEPTPTLETPTPRSSPAPPTPITLSDVSSEWVPHNFSDLGISLLMPANWKVARMPGAYFFEPMTTTNKIYKTQFTIDGQDNVPTELSAMVETLTEEWQRLTPADFYTMPIVVDGYEGVAFWNLSAAICVKIYIPVGGFVHHITFFSTFCNEADDQLNEVGQRILESIEFQNPAN